VTVVPTALKVCVSLRYVLLALYNARSAQPPADSPPVLGQAGRPVVAQDGPGQRAIAVLCQGKSLSLGRP